MSRPGSCPALDRDLWPLHSWASCPAGGRSCGVGWWGRGGGWRRQVVAAEGIIYMVLEYGDIDLARLLAKQEARRKAVPGAEPDENFIRLYWQQMLQVHTCTCARPLVPPMAGDLNADDGARYHQFQASPRWS